MNELLNARAFWTARPRGASRVRALAFLFLADILAGASGLPYKQSSPLIYDAAALIDARDFNSHSLHGIFGRFAADECGARSLARMVVATTERDLGDAMNAILPAAVSDAQIQSAEARAMRVAEVLCFGGQVTSVVRDGRSIVRESLRGEGDSHNVTVEGVPLNIVGFRLRTESANAAISASKPLPDRVWLYVRVQAVPSTEIAARIHANLQRRLGVRLYLIIRTDPYFFDFDGPICDVFEIGERRYTKALLDQPTMVCRPDANPAACGFFRNSNSR